MPTSCCGRDVQQLSNTDDAVIDQCDIDNFAAIVEELVGIKPGPVFTFGKINDPMEKKFDQSEKN